MRRVFIIAILIAVMPVSALSDITGPARVIDGDTIDLTGYVRDNVAVMSAYER